MKPLLDMGRDDLDIKVREAGNGFLREAETLAAQLVPMKLREIELQYGIPGSYLFFVLSKRPQEARRTLGRDYNAAQAARNLWVAKNTNFDAIGNVQVPPSEAEPYFDAALQEFGAWANTTFKQRLAKVYVDVLKRKANEYVRKAGIPVSVRDARIALYRDLPLRVQDHPFWFYDAITLQRLTDML